MATAVMTEREANRIAWQKAVDARIRRIMVGLEEEDGNTWRCVHTTGAHWVQRGMPCDLENRWL